MFLLVCLVVPVLTLSACTSRGGQSGDTEPSSFPAPGNGENATKTAAPVKETQSGVETPVDARKETPGPSGAPDTSNLSETESVPRTDEAPATDVPTEIDESTETDVPTETGTDAPSGTDSHDSAGQPAETPGPTDGIDPSKPTDDPREASPLATLKPGATRDHGSEPGADPTPTPDNGIVVDEHGNIILPEIPIP